jgi:hypothetical protein
VVMLSNFGQGGVRPANRSEPVAKSGIATLGPAASFGESAA